MPIVNIVPATPTVEDVLAGRMTRIRERVKETICDVSGFSPDDVLINLLKCPYRDADPSMADFIVYADTCPNKELEAKANELCEGVTATLVDLGFVEGTIEVWPRFLPGPWCLIENGVVSDSVEYPR